MAESKELTIAQALRRIKDIKGKVAKHGHNAQVSVTHKTKDPPAFSFGAEWEKATGLVDEMIELQTRVAIANSKTFVDWDGRPRPLTWCTKRLAEIKGAITWYEALQVRAQRTTVDDSYEWTEGAPGGRVRVQTEYTCHLPEADRATRVEVLQTKFAELNDLVERENHKTAV